MDDWRHLPPLTAEERAAQQVLTTQIGRFFAWGKMDEARVPEFRGVAAALGGRGLAEWGRTLDAVDGAHPLTAAEADAMVDRVDALQYFAQNRFSNAARIVRDLATRELPWDGESGRLLDKAKSQVTFDMFNIWSATAPQEALDFVERLDGVRQKAYLYHYFLGRQMANADAQETYAQLEQRFGREALPQDIRP